MHTLLAAETIYQHLFEEIHMGTVLLRCHQGSLIKRSDKQFHKKRNLPQWNLKEFLHSESPGFDFLTGARKYICKYNYITILLYYS